ncbi:uncharacterized protein RAG0_14220 [Rhynchosporium agropyri]|uniref:Anaphase-promoting complex, subunit CDC26 n=1 Tax=Rhynchosporium agropyri TaxID=914238 RepID=A0A1E1LG13_9HELO|nr:uncharacterized protein RAG0_14220 [Rhynchosporium agropyri]
MLMPRFMPHRASYKTDPHAYNTKESRNYLTIPKHQVQPNPTKFAFTITNMLRRKPTAITLTTEDIAIYEDSRAREAQAQEEEHQAALEAERRAQYGTPQRQSQNTRDPNDELRPLPADRARAQQQQHVKTREERLGIGMGNAGGSRG